MSSKPKRSKRRSPRRSSRDNSQLGHTPRPQLTTEDHATPNLSHRCTGSRQWSHIKRSELQERLLQLHPWAELKNRLTGSYPTNTKDDKKSLLVTSHEAEDAAGARIKAAEAPPDNKVMAPERAGWAEAQPPILAKPAGGNGTGRPKKAAVSEPVRDEDYTGNATVTINQGWSGAV